LPTRDEFVAGVTAFLAARKTLAGIDSPQQWQPNRDGARWCAKIPLAVNGTLYGQTLVIETNPSASGAEFSIGIVFDDVCVTRLDFDEAEGHTNSIAIPRDDVPYIVSGSHIHRWEHNHRFVEWPLSLPRLRNAVEIPPSIRRFEPALRWFCDEMSIELPHGHRIELPPELLL
jgi:hypothetical protein